jgi:hypothetical protein
MLVVREQDRVNSPELGRAACRSLGLGQRPLSDRKVARRIEGRIEEESNAAELQQRGRAAEVPNADSVHHVVVMLPLRPAYGQASASTRDLRAAAGELAGDHVLGA